MVWTIEANEIRRESRFSDGSSLAIGIIRRWALTLTLSRPYRERGPEAVQRIGTF